MANHLSVRVVSDILRELIGTEALQVCIVTFRQRFITPGNHVDLADWPTVQRLQTIMTTLNLKGLYDDPVTAAAERELTSDSDADQH